MYSYKMDGADGLAIFVVIVFLAFGLWFINNDDC